LILIVLFIFADEKIQNIFYPAGGLGFLEEIAFFRIN